MNNIQKNIFIPGVGVLKTDTFSSLYPLVNHYIFTESEYKPSRGGNVKEILDIKTQLTNPYRRCVGGYERNINIFFLIAEAIWIALGRKDVNLLTLFNEKMLDFSDDGEVFHAPYGYRLRHWGIRSEDKFTSDNLDAQKGYDQLMDSIRILSENPDSRQIVMSIWNPNFDLGYKTKDIPCNDIVMLKIRDKKLITTIANRSNDLHWGLPTNIFQFSFLTELIAGCLEIELGTQTHNSQSLHIYEENKISKDMDTLFMKKIDEEIIGDMYQDCGAKERRIDFNFSHEVPVNRFREIEYHLQIIVDNLIRVSKKELPIDDEIQNLENFSKYLYNSFQLLKIYLEYKNQITLYKKEEYQERDLLRSNSILKIEDLEYNEVGDEGCNWDISMLAKNFFASRLSSNNQNYKYIGKL